MVRDMIAATHVGIHSGSQHFGHRAQRRTGPDHPAPETRVNVPHRVRENVFLEVPVSPFCAFRQTWYRAPEARSELGRDRAPYGPVAHGSEILQQIIHHAVAQRAKLVPVLRVERFLGLESLGGSHVSHTAGKGYGFTTA